MDIHNFLTIDFPDRKKDAHFESYNSMLVSLFDELRNLNAWNKYFAFGSGKNATTENQTTLETFVVAYESFLLCKQINPELENVCSVTKQVSFQADDNSTFSFSEVGICKNQTGNPTCFSRFVISDANGDAIVLEKKPGERMVVSITVNISRDLSSNTNFIAGENLYIDTLLGINELTAEQKVFKVAGGLSLCENEEIVSRDEMIGKGIVATNIASSDNEILNLQVDLYDSKYVEFVILLNDIPVFRNNACNMVKNYQETITADSLNYVNLSKEIVTKISNVLEVASNTYYGDYVKIKYAKTIGSVNLSPFEFNYNGYESIWHAKDGLKTAVVFSSRIDVYEIVDDNFKRLDSHNIIYRTGIQNIDIFSDYIFVHYWSGANSYIDYYHLENGVFVKKIFDMSAFTPVFAKIYQVCFLIVRGNWIKFCYLLSVPGKLNIIDTYFDDDHNLFFQSNQMTYNNALTFCTGTLPNEKYDAVFFMFNTTASEKYYITNENGTFSSDLKSYTIQTFLSNITSPIMSAGRYIYTIRTDKSIGLMDPYCGSTLYDYCSGDRFLCVSTNGKYIFRSRSSGNDTLKYFSKLDTSSVYAFTQVIPEPLLSSSYSKVEICGNMLLFYLNDTTNPFATLSLNEFNHTIYSNGIAGKSMRITYDYNEPANCSAYNLQVSVV